jgi:hypothetical protein
MNKIFIIIFALLTHSAMGQNTNKNKVTSLNGKTIDFYLNNPQIDKNSKLYYNGLFVASFDSITFSIIDSLLTKNNQTRPFYLFVFNQILKKSDGALSEHIATISEKYFDSYPCEFFNIIISKEYPISNNEWASFIGFYLHDRLSYIKFRQKIDLKLKTCQTNKDAWNKFKIALEKNLQEGNSH